MNFLISAAQTNRGFYYAVAVCFVLKLLFAWIIPVVGDEAYFTIWGSYPALGYYDHPPMAGWLMSGMLFLSEHPLVIRMPAVMSITLTAVIIHLVLQRWDARKARIAALLFLISPVFLFNVIFTTDTPLIFFGFLSAITFFVALEKNQSLYFAASGVFLGLAFLSKYFAVLLALSFALHVIIFARSHYLNVILLFLCALPFGAVNLYYNYNQCWYNILFNLINRQSGNEGYSVGGMLIFLAFLLYLIMPWIIWQLLQNKNTIMDRLKNTSLKFFITVSALPLIIFFFMSGFREVGLHWLFLFIVLAYPLYISLPQTSLQKSLLYTGWFTFIHFILLVTVYFFPVNLLGWHDSYNNIVFYSKPGLVAHALKDYNSDFFATDSYSASATLSYNTSHYWSVFGTGSRYGREDDRITDWRNLSGKNMLFFRRKEIQRDRIDPFFESTEYSVIEIKGANFYIVLARNFNYEAYRKKVLSSIHDKYYNIPDMLPLGKCDFLQRYFTP